MQYRFLISAVIGLIYALYAGAFWNVFSASNPIEDWLVSEFLFNGNNAAYYTGHYLHELLINVVLAIPPAWALFRLNKDGAVAGLLVAVISALALAYWPYDPELLGTIVDIWLLWPGVAISIFSLPLAYGLVLAVRYRNSETSDATVR